MNYTGIINLECLILIVIPAFLMAYNGWQESYYLRLIEYSYNSDHAQNINMIMGSYKRRVIDQYVYIVSWFIYGFFTIGISWLFLPYRFNMLGQMITQRNELADTYKYWYQLHTTNMCQKSHDGRVHCEFCAENWGVYEPNF